MGMVYRGAASPGCFASDEIVAFESKMFRVLRRRRAPDVQIASESLGARAFRRRLALQAVKPGAGVETLLGAVDEVRTAIARFAEAEAAKPADVERAEIA